MSRHIYQGLYSGPEIQDWGRHEVMESLLLTDLIQTSIHQANIKPFWSWSLQQCPEALLRMQAEDSSSHSGLPTTHITLMKIIKMWLNEIQKWEIFGGFPQEFPFRAIRR